MVEKYPYPDIGQEYEAVADHFATLITANKIETLAGKEAQRQAIREILFSFPPSSFNEEERSTMDSVGSKQTNESRMLKIFLANNKIKKLLGCEHQKKPPPKDCSSL